MIAGPSGLPPHLYRGIKQLMVCDSGAVVAGIVDFVVSQHRGLRLIRRVLRPGHPLTVAVILVNAARCLLGVECSGHGATIVAARRPNERREVARLKRMLPDRDWTDLVYRWRPGAVVSGIGILARALVSDGRRASRLAAVLSRRYGVFHAVRAMELVAYYRRYIALFAARSFQLAVMSSHSNPHGIAFNLAAKRRGVPVVLITHGMPVRPLARLDYDLAILECTASRQDYEDAGCRMHSIVIKSRKDDYRPIPQRFPTAALTVGVFLSKDPAENAIIHCLRLLLADAGVERVVIRPHPVNLWRGMAACVDSLGTSRVLVRSSGSLSDDLQLCDLVLAGNSTVLLDAVVAGRPSCYVRGFDNGPYDVQRFVRDRLIYEWQPRSPIDVAPIETFYDRAGWQAILRRYADVDSANEEVTQAVAAAVNALAPADATAGDIA